MLFAYYFVIPAPSRFWIFTLVVSLSLMAVGGMIAAFRNPR